MSELEFGRVRGRDEFFLAAPASHYDQASGLTKDVRHIIRIPATSMSWLALQALLALSEDERQFVLMGVEETV